MDFGNVTGVTVSLDQRRLGIVSSTIDYTWQMARGIPATRRRPRIWRRRAWIPRPRQVPFNWDQRAHPEHHAAALPARRLFGEQPSALRQRTAVYPIHRIRVRIADRNELRTQAGGLPGGSPAGEVLPGFRLEPERCSRGSSICFDATYFNGFVYSNTGSPYYSLTPRCGQKFACRSDPVSMPPAESKSAYP